MRAIDPVFATLILIIVSVVAGVVAYAFVSSFVSQSTYMQSPSSLVIDAAVIDEDGSVYLDVRNLSDRPIQLTSYMILDSQNLQTVAYGDCSTTLQPFETKHISASPTSGSVTVGELYIVKVLVADGSSAAISAKCTNVP